VAHACWRSIRSPPTSIVSPASVRASSSSTALVDSPTYPSIAKVEQHARPTLLVAVPGRPAVELAQRLDGVAGEQTGVACVDRLDLEAVLEARVVAVVLAHQLFAEGLGGPPVGVEVHAAAMLDAWNLLPVQPEPAPAVATSST
jgi:hypothetical protein